MVIQKTMGIAMVALAIFGFFYRSNIGVVILALVLGIIFLVSRKVIFEI